MKYPGGLTKEDIDIIRRLAKEDYNLRTGRNADDDPNWWEFMKREMALIRESTQWMVRYLKMGLSPDEARRRALEEEEVARRKNIDEHFSSI